MGEPIVDPIANPVIPADPVVPIVPGEAPAFNIPAEYSEKEYMKEIKSNEDLYKSYDNLQQLLGRRPAGLPGDDATDEDWETYNNTMRPETFDKYEFDDSALPEGFTRDAESEKATKEIFHKAGLTARQAKMIQTEYEKSFMDQNSNSLAKAELQDSEFEELSTKVFGERKDEALSVSKELLEKHAPAEFKEHLASLDNKSLMMLASVLDKVNATYIKEDGPGGDGGSTGTSGKEKRAEAIELMGSEAYKDAFHPNHDETKNKVNDIYASLK